MNEILDPQPSKEIAPLGTLTFVGFDEGGWCNGCRHHEDDHGIGCFACDCHVVHFPSWNSSVNRFLKEQT